MRAEWLARILLPRMRAYAKAHDPSLEIEDNSEDRKIYLRRWHVLPRGAWWRPSLYLHNMLGDDNAVLHDHPYWSLSLVLSDGLVERYCEEPLRDSYYEQSETGNYDLRVLEIKTRRIPAGSIVFRSSNFAHQLLVEKGSDPWTLFFTGRRLKKDWGFWCPRGWRHWRRFHGSRDVEYDPATYGKTPMNVGCGEQS